MGRTILGVLAGLVVAWLVMSLCEFGSVALHPPSPGLNLRHPEALALHIASAPLSALLLVLAGWVLGAFFGGWVAAKIARHRLAAALVIGALMVLGVIANNLLVPHPLWMTIAGITLPIPAAWFAARLARPKVMPA